MIYIKRFLYTALYEDFKNSSGYKEPCVIKIGASGISNESNIVKYNLDPLAEQEVYTLLL